VSIIRDVKSRRLSREQIQRLYEEHSRGLVAYSCSFVQAYAAAEDVLQQTFEKLLRGEFEIIGSPVPYLYRAVRNASLNYIRDHSRETPLEAGWLRAVQEADWTPLMLESALQQLPEEQRAVIVLHIWGRMSFEEVATVLGIFPNTAASRYRYGLAKLREQFQGVTR
jgi:RNA polymerase sigma-70 factor (ECF subfamily)